MVKIHADARVLGVEIVIALGLKEILNSNDVTHTKVTSSQGRAENTAN